MTLRPTHLHEATVEEIAGIGRNRQFDECVDDPDDASVQVLCRRPNPSPTGPDDQYLDVPLANPSRAFYFGDRVLYNQEARRFETAERAEVLRTDLFPSNDRIFDEIRRACQRGLIIPFVGAGLSRSAGLPDWKGYLLDKAADAGLVRADIEAELNSTGAYEGVMDRIVRTLGVNVFERDFERDFTAPDVIEGPAALLPELFDCCVITTNFDRVLEKAYDQAKKTFTEKVTGRGNSKAFFRAVPAGDRYLLKLHGNIDNASERVLLKSEYDAAYGDVGNIDLNAANPRQLRRLFTSYSFLFLGCSLATDRTIQTFKAVAGQEGHDNLPRHYAIQCCPTDPASKRVTDQRLADANITALWYPDGAHEKVQEILELLSR